MKIGIFIFKKVFGRSLDTIGLNILTTFTCLILLYNGIDIVIGPELFWVILMIDLICFAKAVWWNLRVGKRESIYGFLRSDNTLEIHIGSTNSPDFHGKMRKTIRYAQKHGHLLEYTSGILSHGEIMNRYGEAVVSLRPLGFIGQIWNGCLASTFTGNNPNYSIDHPLKVVIDPRKIRRSRSLGNRNEENSRQSSDIFIQ